MSIIFKGVFIECGKAEKFECRAAGLEEFSDEEILGFVRLFNTDCFCRGKPWCCNIFCD